MRGRLLVATPDLRDPNFRRTVVLVLAHADEGTLGVVLNRPSHTEVGDMLPAWASLAARPQRLFLGGPVNLDQVIGLARIPGGVPGGDGDATSPVVGDVVPVDLNGTPEAVPGPISGMRLFAGSSGWGPRQLEGEIDEGAWFVVDAVPGDVTSDDPIGLWERVLRRQPGRVAWFANAAGEPEHN